MAMPTRLEVSHETRYAYPQPVALAHHLAHLKPIADRWQQLEDFTLTIEPTPAQMRDSLDAWGNGQCHFSLVQPHEALVVRASSRVALQPRFVALDAEASPPWESLAARVRYVAGAPFVPAVEFALPSPFVPRLPALREAAAWAFTPGRPVAALALALMERLHAEYRYESRSTEVDTPLAQVMQQRRGVCQDFAHLLIGQLRAFGLPARYVSGYLLTHAPEGDGHSAPLLGADASHAWVQLWCPGTPGVPSAEGAGDDPWLDLDPTNNCIPGSGHVRVAVGRDFGDVTPLRGVIRGGGEHSLVVAVHTRRIEPAPVARLVQSQSQGLTQGQSQAQSQSDPTRPMENTGS
jgi:transglutaminase-like putative cysteine protease